MDLRSFFKEVGGDYDAVLTRLVSESLIRRFIGKFQDDPTYNLLMTAIEDQDIDQAFIAAHTLKGTAANLGFDKLAKAASELTEELRDSDVMPSADYIKKVDNAYKNTVDRIKLLAL